MEVNKIELYHGTSSTFNQGILDNGLRPWNEIGLDPRDFGSNRSDYNLVYLTDTLSNAINLSRHAIKKYGGSSIVVVVSVDIENLRGDSPHEDYQYSLDSHGTCSHLGPIYPVDRIITDYYRDPSFPLSQEISTHSKLIFVKNIFERIFNR
jgi:hypothetical protein